MKKLVLFAAVLGAVSLTSCKKTYTCTCTGTMADSTFEVEDPTSEEKDAAEAACLLLDGFAQLASESCTWE